MSNVNIDLKDKIWTYVAFFLGVLILVMVVVVCLILFEALQLITTKGLDYGFAFASSTVIVFTFLRLLAILIGGAIAFAGLAHTLTHNC